MKRKEKRKSLGKKKWQIFCANKIMFKGVAMSKEKGKQGCECLRN